MEHLLLKTRNEELGDSTYLKFPVHAMVDDHNMKNFLLGWQNALLQIQRKINTSTAAIPEKGFS